MAYELRAPQFDLSGSLASAIDAAATSITGKGALFTSLRTDLSTGLYIPLTIADDGLGKSEIVWATSHSSASPTVGVIRGREGTAPLQFDAGAIVRCSPTIRDVEGLYANRAALPADPHIGMRALLQDEVLTVERTSTGWDDSAALKADPNRKHRWTQTGAALAAGAATTLGGLGSSQNGTTGNIATQNAGILNLNGKAGFWVIALAFFGNNTASRNQGLQMNWPSGAFPGGVPSKYDYRGIFGGSAINGTGVHELSWSGYVNAAQAAQPITCQAFSSIALTGCQYDIFAEFCGA